MGQTNEFRRESCPKLLTRKKVINGELKKKANQSPWKGGLKKQKEGNVWSKIIPT